MKRRAFVHGLTALPVAALSQSVLAAPPKAADQAVVVYHFVSLRCEDCQRWDQKHLPRWLNSGEFRRSSYRRIEGKTAEEALDPRRWPSEIRALGGTPEMRQTPAFIVVRQGHVAAAASGENAWTDIIWPAIRRAAA